MIIFYITYIYNNSSLSLIYLCIYIYLAYVSILRSNNLRLTFVFSNRQLCRDCVSYAVVLHTVAVCRFRREQGNEADFGRGRTIASGGHRWLSEGWRGLVGRGRNLGFKYVALWCCDLPQTRQRRRVATLSKWLSRHQRKCLGTTLPRRRPPSHVPTCVPALYRQPSKFLSRERERRERSRKMRFRCSKKIKGQRDLRNYFSPDFWSFERVRRFERKFSSFRLPRCILSCCLFGHSTHVVNRLRRE